jgi:putative ABC transport system substrate-binding protein
MRRRHFVTLLGGAMLAPASFWPLPLMAQPFEKPRRIGILIPYPESDVQAQLEVAAMRDRLQQLGWAGGRNARITVRWAAGDIGQIQAYAKELVSLQPDVIVARTTPATAALIQETRTIPIVFVGVSDPVGPGYVASVARPGGNVTGYTNVEAPMAGKWVEVLREIRPDLTRIFVMFGAKTSPEGGAFYFRMVQNSARSVGVETIATPVEDAAGIDRAFEALPRQQGIGLIVQPDVTTTTHRALIIAQAARRRLPAVYPFRYFANEGGLATYGIDTVDVYRQAAGYIDRILRGEKPGDLPVQGPTKFELAINLKTASALGLELPAMLLGRADDVID